MTGPRPHPPRRAAAVIALTAALTALSGCKPPPAIEALPGAATYPPALAGRLQAALVRRQAEAARSRHRRADGAPRWTNRLILESSPYLLQHAHNPVDWYPWGEEAFARALAEGKPVLLSVGYSTCHWCHVMEEESFEDEEIAAYLNGHYVAIKVDREERPDVDAIYMTAVQVLTSRGGWPMTVWLTPTREPFYAGTYFPARDGERGMRIGFLTLLQRLDEVFRAEPLRIAQQADAVTERVRELTAPPPGEALPEAAILRRAYEHYAGRFDAAHGGFGKAPKFPTPAALDFLLRYHRRTGEPHALAMVTRTLEGLATGGIHDHVGGGFHRYATDAAWRVPHFEKMLYDNAQLAAVYLDAWQATGREDFAKTVRDVLDWVAREMTAPGGGFYSATDADSEGEEGKFFVWTPAEVRAALPAEAARAALVWWDVTEPGHWEGKSVLHTPRPLADVAADLGVPPETLVRQLDDARRGLYAARARRVPPHTDTKVLASWNGLMISAFARAGAALPEPAYVERARTAAAFVLDRMRVDGHLQRSFADGAPHQAAFLDDHAFLAAGLLDLYEATFDLRWLREALALHETLAREFWDEDAGGFFTTAHTPAPGIAREKPAADDALPSGNAVAAQNLLRLAELTTDDRQRERADAVLRALARGVTESPASAPRLLAVLDFRLDRAKEIVIVHPGGSGDGADALLTTVRRTYLPNHVLTVTAEGPELARQAALIPLVGEKRALGGASTAYVCEERVCARPTGDPVELARQLAAVAPLPDGGATRATGE